MPDQSLNPTGSRSSGQHRTGRAGSFKSEKCVARGRTWDGGVAQRYMANKYLGG